MNEKKKMIIALPLLKTKFTISVVWRSNEYLCSYVKYAMLHSAKESNANDIPFESGTAVS